jgi:RND family efflux transporter MFP subunit
MKSFIPCLVGLIVPALPLMLAGCGRESSDQSGRTPLVVTVSIPVEREVTDYSDQTGRTAAVDTVELRARVWGYLEKVNFKEGALVKRNDVLFEIDPRTYKAIVSQAEGNLAAGEAKLKRLELELKRAETLVKKQTIAQQEYEKALFDRDQAGAQIVTLKANLEQAKLDLEFTKVTAPVAGRVGRAIVTEGNLVQSGQAGGTLLTSLVSVDPMWAYFDVDERTVLRVRGLIREGKAKSARDVPLPVFLGLANEEGYPHEGTIDFVDNQVNPKTGTLKLRGVFPNKDEALAPGYFVRIRVPIGFPHKALLISDRAIDTDQGKKIVYVVDSEKKVAIRPIRPGSLHEGLRAIDEGLKSGDRVMVAGLQQVRPGLVVEPKLVDMPGQISKSEPRNPKQTQNPKSQ